MILSKQSTRADRAKILNLVWLQWFDQRRRYKLPCRAYLAKDLAISNQYLFVKNEAGQCIGALLARRGTVGIFNKIYWYALYLLFRFLSIFCTTWSERQELFVEYHPNKRLRVNTVNYENEITLLIIDKSYRNQKIGKNLLHAYEQDIATDDNIQLFSDSYSNVDFYLRLGYQIIDRVDCEETGQFYKLVK